ncbi:prolyl 4-hydroxylase subunit alpha-3-like isoform X1 [Drosophila ananassae]|uniref:prolyl 4-hydroxylase subunit alpha-3-like isoform X1 n=1 Tax=Drosophila ananassae TaxID=7217 RepID=UPI0013A5DDC6|nr:prolyl 4-hydroxylase subunit alpha-3-like isoform X1 [Drosophila ananassae]
MFQISRNYLSAVKFSTMSGIDKLFSLLCLLILFIMQGFPSAKNNNYAISIYDLMPFYDLIVLEEYLLSILDRFKHELQNRVITIESYLELMRKGTNSLPNNKFQSDFEETFPIVRRLYSDYSRLVTFLDKKPWDDCIRAINDHKPKMPTAMDIIETTDGLHYMQAVYSIKSSHMAKGILQGVDHNSSLNAFECFTMGMYLEEVNEYVDAKEWLELSLDLYLEDRANRELYAELGFSSVMIYVLYGTVLQHLDEDNKTLTDSLKTEDEVIPKEELQKTDKVIDRNRWERYKSMCSTESRPKTNLYCLYQRNVSRFLFLAPLKIEILSLDPYMVFYYDVILCTACGLFL